MKNAYYKNRLLMTLAFVFLGMAADRALVAIHCAEGNSYPLRWPECWTAPHPFIGLFIVALVASAVCFLWYEDV